MSGTLRSRLRALALGFTLAGLLAVVGHSIAPPAAANPSAANYARRHLGILPASDTNRDRRIFETTLVAMEADVDLDGDGSLERVYTYNGTVPAPELRVQVGDEVIVHFRNELPTPSSIHWHGIELNNASDGTSVTQNSVLTGESYTYRFIAPRPGVFWYHPHFKPTNPEFKGQYGSFIVEDPHEKKLTQLGVLPHRNDTHTLMLADTTVCKAPGENDPVTFPADPDLPWSGPGEFPGQALSPSPEELCEAPMDDRGEPLGTGPLPAGSIPNIQPSANCGSAGSSKALTGIAFVPQQGASPTLYGIDAEGTLYTVDPTSAAIRPVGATGFDETFGLDFDPVSQRLWSGSSDSRSLISIDPATASAVIEASIASFPDADTRDLAFLADGSLYVVGHSPGTGNGTRLYAMDSNSGASTLLLNRGQGTTALPTGELLQVFFARLSTVDVTLDPPVRTTIAGFPQVPRATQLALEPGTDFVYGIDGCVLFCQGELYRFDLAQQTQTPIGIPVETGPSCNANEGQLVVVNGRVPAARAGSPTAPGPVEPGARILDVTAGKGLRLQIIGASVSRYFRLGLTGPDGQALPLYRVGGEGGLLDRVRLEGGVQDVLDTKYDAGEILVAPSGRADVVLTVPDGEQGEIATLWTRDYDHTANGFARIPTVPVLHLRIHGSSAPQRHRYSVDESSELLVHRKIGAPIEDLKGLPITDHLLDPAGLPEPRPGSADEEIRLTNFEQKPTIDGVIGRFEGSADFTLVPHIATSRYARVGDLLELAVSNQTGMHHPFHLHGFSFQPVRMEHSAGNVVRTYDYNEFVDTLDIPAEHTLVFRVRLDDRPMMDGSTPGGALGRWLFHCHIFFHAALGMISELVVLP